MYTGGIDACGPGFRNITRGSAGAGKYPQIHTLLIKQEKEYFWVKNNYVHNNYINSDKWLAELKAVSLAKINLKERIRQIINTPRKNALEKNKLLAYLKPSKKLKVLLKISEDFTHWQDERKKLTRYEMLNEIDRILLDDCPVLPLFYITKL